MWHTKRSSLGRCALAFILVFFLTQPDVSNGGIDYIEPDAASSTSAAVVLDPVPLAHTGQFLPINKKGVIVGQDSVGKQTEQVLKNLSAGLKEAKSDLNKIVKLNVYLRRAALQAEVKKVLAEKFNGKTKPAVTFVAGGLTHPDALVSMDAVAVSSMDESAVKKIGSTSAKDSAVAQAAILPSRGAVYVAGMADKGEISEATRKTLEKLLAAIEHLGLKKKDIVQLKAFIDPIAKAEESKAAVVKFFEGEMAPPIVFVEWVSSSVPIEIELIAADPMREDEVHPPQAVRFLTQPGTTASPVYSRLARINFGRRIYISGLCGQTSPENDVKEIYARLGDLLKKTGSDFDHLAKATYYWSDPSSNARLDAFRPTIYNPKTPPTASKARVKDVGTEGKGINIDMIGVTVK